MPSDELNYILLFIDLFADFENVITMSSRQEKLELARKKLKQYKNKQKQEKGKRGEGRERDRGDNEQQPLQPPPVSGEDHRHEQTTITASSITAAETTRNVDCGGSIYLYIFFKKKQKTEFY